MFVDIFILHHIPKLMTASLFHINQKTKTKVSKIIRVPVDYQCFPINIFHTTERGPHSSWLCSCCPQNKALVSRTLLLSFWETQPNWNQFQNELPFDKGRDHYHFLLHCFDVQISKNMMASQRNICFLKHWIYTFHARWQRAWSWWPSWWMGAWFWINWGGGEWSCVREWWQHCSVNCWNVSIFTGVFLPRPNFAPLSPNITWARESDSLRITWYKMG